MRIKCNTQSSYVTNLKFSLSRSVREYLGFLPLFSGPSKNLLSIPEIMSFIQKISAFLSYPLFIDTRTKQVIGNSPLKNSFLSAPVSTPASPMKTTLRTLVGDAAFFLCHWRMPLSGRSSLSTHNLNSVVVSTCCSRQRNTSSTLNKNRVENILGSQRKIIIFRLKEATTLNVIRNYCSMFCATTFNNNLK